MNALDTLKSQHADYVLVEDVLHDTIADLADIHKGLPKAIGLDVTLQQVQQRLADIGGQIAYAENRANEGE